MYYTGIFWNSYEQVIAHLNQRAYDLESGSWVEHLRTRRTEPYERALSLNCGNGWVERSLVAAGVVRSIVAVDFLEPLLQTAREASVGQPIEFVQMDTNAAEFPPGPYDLVVNHAAGHHIANLDRVFRRLRELLEPDGTLVTWDYTGPHRNQYGRRIWEAAHAVNRRLPVEYRSPMAYPHLPTMLVADPTEAVHSELLLETMDRYFVPIHQRSLGGPIAYLLLTHNERLYAAPPEERDPLVRMILAADIEHIENFPEDNLFTFAISRPRPATELAPEMLARWARAEDEREQQAAAGDGRYYLPTPIQLAEYGAGSGAPSPAGSEPTPYEAALRGVRFNAAALVRSVAIRVPAVIPVLRALRSAARAVGGRRRRHSGEDAAAPGR